MRERRSIDPLRIVVIGGGNGLSAMLHGLKDLILGRNGRTVEIDLTAVVTVTDDGGSSGRLRREFDVLPPGDIRNCMVAMSEDEGLLSRLFQYRFRERPGPEGSQLRQSVPHGADASDRRLRQGGAAFLRGAGELWPHLPVDRNQRDSGGRVSRTARSSPAKRASAAPVRGSSRCGCGLRDVDPHPETLEAIAAADLISFGPGSLFTSVIPNVLVNGIPDAIRNSPAMKAYFVNLMWQPGETNEFTASDHVRAIHQHAGLNLIDVAIMNTRPITATLKSRYAGGEGPAGGQ